MPMCNFFLLFYLQHMKTNEEADAAIENLKGYSLNGNTLTVEASTSRPRSTRGGAASSSTGRDDPYASGGWDGFVLPTSAQAPPIYIPVVCFLPSFAYPTEFSPYSSVWVY